MSVGVVIPAAGNSTRMQLQDGNKTFLQVEGIPVIIHTLRAFAKCPFVDHIVVVARPADIPEIERLVTEWEVAKVQAITSGGKERQDSVYCGLKALNSETTEWVFIHDGARPLVSLETLEKVYASVQQHKAVGVGVPVKDTIKVVEDGIVESTLDRAKLWAIQTPQAFAYELILKAHGEAERLGIVATDDCALIEREGHKVHLVEGQYENIKITTPSDLRVMEAMIDSGKNQRTAVGFGFDVHRLVSGRKLVLCGVEIPFEKGLDGHSDADVAVHALMDALLGASGLGDIGRHFPDSSAEFKDISSLILLSQVKKLLAKHTINNIDITIVAQKPKIAPYVEQMRISLAAVLGISSETINIKGTTTEFLGYTGRGEGIAAYATCALQSSNSYSS